MTSFTEKVEKYIINNNTVKFNNLIKNEPEYEKKLLNFFGKKYNLIIDLLETFDKITNIKTSFNILEKYDPKTFYQIINKKNQNSQTIFLR